MKTQSEVEEYIKLHIGSNPKYHKRKFKGLVNSFGHIPIYYINMEGEYDQNFYDVPEKYRYLMPKGTK